MTQELRFDFSSCTIPYPPTQEPVWSAQVERWYQLDQAAFSLCEAYFQLDLHSHVKPFAVLLASPTGSFVTDREFALGGAQRPAKFVHTLPNIRASVLFQVMQWNGPMLCLQNDPKTLIGAFEQCPLFARTGVWIVGYWGNGEAYFVRTHSEGAFQLEESTARTPEVNDEQVYSWLKNPRGTLAGLNGWCLKKSGEST